MRIQFVDAKIFDSEHASFIPGCLTVADGRIIARTAAGECAPDADEIVSLGGRLLAPGLVDVHTHGRAGFDFSSADAAGMRHMARAYAAAGVTALLPTLASAETDELRRAARTVADLREQGTGGARFLGLHFEGRYLNPARRGAHAPELLVSLDADEIERLIFDVCPPPVHVTAALELDESGEFISRVRSLGGTVGLGHTNATLAQALMALDRGAVSFTHLYNTMPSLHHREPGPICAALTTDAYVEMICDGLHIHPRMVAMTYRIKRKDRFVLVTDSMEATGEPDGEYTIAGMPVTVRDGRAVTHDGALAGSLLSLFDAVKNLACYAGITFGEALRCATRAPADMIGVDCVGDLLPGRFADFLVLEGEDPQIAEVWMGGARI
ncbi:MAG: N-acetylglucosamine-6-phosphate deacetylase [Clostridia bacterium]|nr:N-acetylglucosamine-6-phosphate deacetylase [Clostridia bacterium]